MSLKGTTKMGVDNQIRGTHKPIASPRLHSSSSGTDAPSTKLSPRPVPRLTKSTLSTEAKTVRRKSPSSSVKRKTPKKDEINDSASESVASTESLNIATSPRPPSSRKLVASSDDIRVGDSSGNKIQRMIRQYNSFNSKKNVADVAKARFSRLPQFKSKLSSDTTAESISQPDDGKLSVGNKTKETHVTSSEEYASVDLKTTKTKNDSGEVHKINKNESVRTESEVSTVSPTDPSKPRSRQTRPTSLAFNRSDQKQNSFRSSQLKDTNIDKLKPPDPADSSVTKTKTHSIVSQLSVQKQSGSRSPRPSVKLKRQEPVTHRHAASSPPRASFGKTRDLHERSGDSSPRLKQNSTSGIPINNKPHGKMSVKMGTKSPIFQKKFQLQNKETNGDSGDLKLTVPIYSENNHSLSETKKSALPQSANRTNKSSAAFSSNIPGSQLYGSKQRISGSEVRVPTGQPDMSVTSAESRSRNVTTKNQNTSMFKLHPSNKPVTAPNNRKVTNINQHGAPLDMSVTSGVILIPNQNQANVDKNDSEIDMSVTSAMSLSIDENKKYTKTLPIKQQLVKYTLPPSPINDDDKTKASEDIQMDMSVTSAGLIPLDLDDKQYDSGISPDMTVTSAQPSRHDAPIHSTPNVDSSETIMSVRQRALIFSGGDDAKVNVRKRDNGKVASKKLATNFNASDKPDEVATSANIIHSIPVSKHIPATQQPNGKVKHETFPNKERTHSPGDISPGHKTFSESSLSFQPKEYLTYHIISHEKVHIPKGTQALETKLLSRDNETIETNEILEDSLTCHGDILDCQVQTPDQFSDSIEDFSSVPLAESTPCEGRPTEDKFDFSQSEAKTNSVCVDTEANRASSFGVNIRKVSEEYQKATDRINLALVTLKTELKAMREQDLLLLRQLINISETIQRMSGTRKLRLSKSLSLSLTGSFQQHQQMHGRGLSSSMLERQSSVSQVEDLRSRKFFSSSRHFQSVEDSMNSVDESEFGSMASELDSTLFSSTSSLSLHHQFSPVSPEPRPVWAPLEVAASHESLLDGSEHSSYEEILRRNVRLWKLSSGQEYRPAVVEEVTCLL